MGLDLVNWTAIGRPTLGFFPTQHHVRVRSARDNADEPATTYVSAVDPNRTETILSPDDAAAEPTTQGDAVPIVDADSPVNGADMSSASSSISQDELIVPHGSPAQIVSQA